MTETKKVKKKARKFNWDAIELDYRKGLFSFRVLAEMHGPSESAIRKKAKQRDWKKDLHPEIKRRAQEKISAQKVLGQTGLEAFGKTDEDLIEDGADLIVRIIRGHREQIQIYQEIVAGFGTRLKEQIANKTIEVRIPGTSGKMEIDIPLDYVGKGLTSGVGALERLIKMERQAFSVDSGDENKGATYEDYLEEMRQEGNI